MATIPTPARRTDITGLITLPVEFSSAPGHGSMDFMAMVGMATMVAVIMAAAFTDVDLIETASGAEGTAGSEAAVSAASEAVTSTAAVVASFTAVEVESSTVEGAAVRMEADAGKRSEYP
jgi:hypothetical protein